MGEVFFLAYGGLHWSYADILALPLRVRKRFVEMLERQIELEREDFTGGLRSWTHQSFGKS